MTRPTLVALAGLLGVVLGVATPTAAQNGYGYQIQQKIENEWQPFKTPLGRYAPLQSETVCNLDLASAVSLMPSGTILACRRIKQPIPLVKGN